MNGYIYVTQNYRRGTTRTNKATRIFHYIHFISLMGILFNFYLYPSRLYKHIDKGNYGNVFEGIVFVFRGTLNNRFKPVGGVKIGRDWGRPKRQL